MIADYPISRPPFVDSLWTAADRLGTDPLIDLGRLYPAKRAFLFPLTQRGLYSEVNLLINALSFSLLEQAHFLVDPRPMNVDWAGLFDTRFPTYDEAAPDPAYSKHKVITIKAGRRDLFDYMRHEFWRMIAAGEIVRVPQFGFEGTIEALNASVAALVFRPSAGVYDLHDDIRRRLGLERPPEAALQLRSGDKTVGFLKPNGKRNIEGDVVDGQTYIDEMRRAGLNSGTVLVITDDYAAFEQLVAANPAYRFVTNCPPDMAGYFHEAFSQQTQAQRTADAARMVAEVMLASEAGLFLGPYRSNLSSFTHLLRYPRPSISVDRQRRWTPL